MMKKTILILFLLALVTSCGIKGDPEYKTSKNTNSPIKIV